MTRHYQKKIKLGVAGRRIKWAPVWALLKKYGTGSAKYHHVSEITKHKRHWRKDRFGSAKLRLKPRKIRKSHLG